MHTILLDIDTDAMGATNLLRSRSYQGLLAVICQPGPGLRRDVETADTDRATATDTGLPSSQASTEISNKHMATDLRPILHNLGSFELFSP